MALNRIDVPVAHSMVRLAKRVHQQQDVPPFQRFLCYWMAFNNIYIVLGEQEGLFSTLLPDEGAPITREVAGRQIPNLHPPREWRLINVAKSKMSPSLKQQLILHPSVEFFVTRVPRWRGDPLTHDAHGQRLNGVLNVGYTVSAQYPVWSPIDSEKYHKVKRGSGEPGDLDDLASQLVDVLYTVRNNLVHGGKRADDSNDGEVVEKALPLLQMIVDYFLARNQRQQRSTLSKRGKIS
jgi:hypothetical protein